MSFNHVKVASTLHYSKYLNKKIKPSQFVGLETMTPQYAPKLSKEFSKHKWAMISCAQHHTIALDEGGKTYAIGRKEYGRLGLGEGCEDATGLVELPALSKFNVIHIGCGSATSFAVTDNGTFLWIKK